MQNFEEVYLGDELENSTLYPFSSLSVNDLVCVHYSVNQNMDTSEISFTIRRIMVLTKGYLPDFNLDKLDMSNYVA